MPGSSWCWVTDGSCASEKAWRRRPCVRSWPLWSRRDAEFSGGHQCVSLYGAMRYAPLLRRVVDDGRACDRVQPLRWPPLGVLESAGRPGEDFVLGSRWLGDLVQAIR